MPFHTLIIDVPCTDKFTTDFILRGGRHLSQPKRIWIFTFEFEPYIIGGLGIAVTNLAKAFTQNGVDITVVTLGKQSSPSIKSLMGMNILRIPQKRPYYLHSIKQFRLNAVYRWLRDEENPDGIHIHSPQFIQIAKFYQKKFDIPVIYTCHSLVALEDGLNDKNKIRAMRLQEQMLRIADRIVVPSHAESITLQHVYPFYCNKVVVIPHGVTKQSNTSRGPQNHLLFVGRIIPIKGVDHLLRAIAILIKKYPTVKLDIIGTGSIGYVRHLKQIARRLGVASRVRWLGYRKQTQIQKMYSSHGALIMPSLQESFGLVALESLASGIPLVATRAGGLSDFVSNKVAQIIPAPKSPYIAAAIEQMWNNQERTNERVSTGRKLANQYQWPQIATRYQIVFQQIIARKKWRRKS